VLFYHNILPLFEVDIQCIDVTSRLHAKNSFLPAFHFLD